jgi:hypothetical protein
MAIRLHTHARTRLVERGATESEVIETVEKGELSPAKHGRTRFRRNFMYNDLWQDRHFASKQIEVIAVPEKDGWLVLTIVTRFF